MCGLRLEALDRRLDPDLTQPICVAVSGGGDSLAALIATKAWADRCGRRVVALHVDHGLQAASGAWRDFTADAARKLGVEFRPSAWSGEKPTSGLAAAARRARHGLIAEAARNAGATVVVFGHTADDMAEAVLMRAEGSSLGNLSEWRPSPVWPEGRGVFVLRPLLGVRRAVIREALRRDNWAWIDDPANEDTRSPRVRARQALRATAVMPDPAPVDARAAALAGAAGLDDWATIRFDRDSLRNAARLAVRRVLAAAMASAGGGERPPRADRIEALAARLLTHDRFTATLAGARLIATDDILIAREAGEAARGGLAAMALQAGRPAVWDGRFEFSAPSQGWSVLALKGLQARLAAADRERLKAAPAAARPALPALADPVGRLVCPILARPEGVEVRSLVAARFLGACGALSKEPRV